MSNDDKKKTPEELAAQLLAEWKIKLTALGATSTGDQEKAFYQGALTALQSGVLK